MDECKPLPAGGVLRRPRRGLPQLNARQEVLPGRALQADSIKTRVESAHGWSQRFKLQYDAPFFYFAFNLAPLHPGDRGGPTGQLANAQGRAV